MIEVSLAEGKSAICLDGENLNVTGNRVLRDIVSTAGLSRVTVTSVARSIDDQARIMYEKLENAKLHNGKRDKYGPAGRAVQQVYDENSNKHRDEIISLMAETIRRELNIILEKQVQTGERKQLMHVQAPGYVVIDVDPSSFKTTDDRNRFLRAVQTNTEKTNFLYPPDDNNSYHIEMFNLPETGAVYEPDPNVSRVVRERRRQDGTLMERYEEAVVGQESVQYGFYQLYSGKNELLESGIKECGKRTGEWIMYGYQNGMQYVSRREHYQNGKMQGSAKYYYPYSKQVREEGYYENNKKQGYWKQYYHDGRIQVDSMYQKGLIHGAYTLYFDSLFHNNNVEHGNYVNGFREGPWSSKRENGRIIEEGNYVHGQKDGAWKSYWDNGQLDVFYTYDQGKVISRQAWSRDGKQLR